MLKGQWVGPRRPGGLGLRRRGRRLLKALVAPALLGGLVALGFWVYSGPIFRVREVQVVGAQLLNPQWVAERAELQGTSMFSLPTGRAEARLGELPLVKEARVQRLWPHGVRIAVTERQPWGYWQAGNREYVVDQEGVVLEGVSAPWDAPTVVVRDSAGDLEPGDQVDAEVMGLARTLKERLPEILGEKPLLFEYSRQDGLAMMTEGGYRLVMGDGRDLEYKLALGRALKKKAQRDGLKVKVMDLRFGDRPSLR